MLQRAAVLSLFQDLSQRLPEWGEAGFVAVRVAAAGPDQRLAVR
ncbi:hypothetical protein [Fodinicola feengrottensis]|nr:hypothetical protein [Fodinicola feengrottensis]